MFANELANLSTIDTINNTSEDTTLEPFNCTLNNTLCKSLQDSEEPIKIYQVLSIGFMAILMVMMVFGNALVIGAYHRAESLKNVTNFFIMNLAVADFCVGLMMPLHIYLFLDPSILTNINVCLFRYASLIVMQAASVLSLMAISVERYIVLTYALTYENSLTPKRTLVIAFLLWMPPIIVAFIMPMVWHEGWKPGQQQDCDLAKVLKYEWLAYISIPGFSIMALVILLLYIKILLIAKTHANRIHEQQNHIRQSSDSTFRHNMRMVKTAAIILGTFFVCWIPFFIILIIQVYGNEIENPLLIQVRVYALMLALFNSTVNPVIYAFRLREFRKEFKKMLNIKVSMYD